MSIPIKIKRKADGSIDNITFCPTVTIEKQVWESTLHRSMALEAENTKFKELLRECLAHLTIGKYGTSVTPINILCDEVEEALK